MQTMRLAVLADTHGNLPALEAVLADIERHNVDHTVVAGDLVGGPKPVPTWFSRSCVTRPSVLSTWAIRLRGLTWSASRSTSNSCTSPSPGPSTD